MCQLDLTTLNLALPQVLIEVRLTVTKVRLIAKVKSLRMGLREGQGQGQGQVCHEPIVFLLMSCRDKGGDRPWAEFCEVVDRCHVPGTMGVF